MGNEVSQRRLLLISVMMVSVGISTGVQAGYSLESLDVIEGAILLGTIAGVIPAILFWKYASQQTERV